MNEKNVGYYVAEPERENMTPGIHYNVPMADYLRERAVSASILTTIVDRCPAAAWWESPWNPRYEPEQADEADNGTVAHAILLEGGAENVEVFNPSDFPNARGEGVATGWSNKAIRQARDAARLAGRIPVLSSQMAEIEAMANAARRFVDSCRGTDAHAVWAAFEPFAGDSEVTLIWEDDATLCRARPDRILKDGSLIVDAKFVTTSAEPARWGRSMLNERRYIGAAHYRRGVEFLFGRADCGYVYLVCEQSPPYLCSLVGVGEAEMAMGREIAGYSLHTWRACAERNQWPGYAPRVAFPEVPAWMAAAWEEWQLERRDDTD